MTEPIIEVHIRRCATTEDARRAASDEAADTGGRVFPAVMFRQGGRTNLALAMTFGNLGELVRRQSAKPGEDPRTSVNRPLMPDHSRTIEDYLVENSSKYVLPSLTLTAASDLSVYAVQTPASTSAAFVVIGSGTQFLVTDGQHRLVALTGTSEFKTKLLGALRRKPELAEDAVALHIVFEKDIERIHQDFADAAQSKQIPASMLAAFNRREPFNRLLAKVVEESPILSDRIDMTSKTLGKKSQKLFLLNQVRGFMKELILGDYAASEDAVARTANEQLATPELQDEWIARGVSLLRILSREMTPWPSIMDLQVGTAAANKIPDLREKYLNMTATGLNLMGRFGNLVFKNIDDHASAQEDFFKRLAALDWSKSNKALWEGNVIAVGTTRILTARTPLVEAFKKIKDATGIPSEW